MLAAGLPQPHFRKLMVTLDGFARLDDLPSFPFASGNSGGGGNDAGGWCIGDGNDEPSGPPLPLLPESRAVHDDWKKLRIPVLGKFPSRV